MKVDIVSHSDSHGGAARAAYRLHKSILKNKVDSQMIVKIKNGDDYTVISSSRVKQILSRGVGYLSNKLSDFQKCRSTILHSYNFIGSFVYLLIKKSNADVVNLHWVNAETLSIRQISKINKPIVMTLHDMWAFCGSEHLAIDEEHSQFRVGYAVKNDCSDHIGGIDLNYLTWKRKKKYWKTQFTIVTPSSWLSQCVRESELFLGWDVYTIPNPLDTDKFKPLDKSFARGVLNLPMNKKLIGFGAMGGSKDSNKGFDLLLAALKRHSNFEDFQCVVFGQSAPESSLDLGLPVTYVGHLFDDESLGLFYNAIDVMVVPSRQESQSQTATEAQSCGTPVVAFSTTGLVDVIEHKVSGYLAKPFEPSDLMEGIQWCIECNIENKLSFNARNRALKLWAQDVVAKQYISLFNKVSK
ncbi:hypothetical protein BCT61_17170 [Vibrio breoganii]|uniref:glycosyltransferase n=1 Tax=Vibrio breoganii TaxID=553239 RepID=UPI000C856B7E|nr:glycosyltransferase [Vibrio breoganii]PMM04231.1 hypothetical protein BCT61_17170 [Vibrio breoganii]